MSEAYLTVGPLHRHTIKRLFEKIAIDPDKQFNGSMCWTWTAATLDSGYGFVGWNRNGKYVTQLSHRIMYAWLVEPLPLGKPGEVPVLDHLCRNRACCNPAHLELVTHQENVRRSPLFHLDRCRKGHPYTPENTVTKQGLRCCRECLRMCDRDRAASRQQERRAKQTCKKGHALAGDNLHIGPNGRRLCKTCCRPRWFKAT